MSRYLDPKSDLAEESAYTPSELAAYDKYWDAISIEKTLLRSAKNDGIAIGIEQGIAIGKWEIAKNMLANGMAVSLVIELTGLSEKELDEIKKFRDSF